jgi:hypothetical protein
MPQNASECMGIYDAWTVVCDCYIMHVLSFAYQIVPSIARYLMCAMLHQSLNVEEPHVKSLRGCRTPDMPSSYVIAGHGEQEHEVEGRML